MEVDPNADHDGAVHRGAEAAGGGRQDGRRRLRPDQVGLGGGADGAEGEGGREEDRRAVAAVVQSEYDLDGGGGGREDVPVGGLFLGRVDGEQRGQQQRRVGRESQEGGRSQEFHLYLGRATHYVQ